MCLIATTFSCGAVHHKFLFAEGCLCHEVGIETASSELCSFCRPPPPPKLAPAGSGAKAVHEALQRALGLDGDGEREGGEEEKGKDTSDFSKLLELEKDKLEKE